MSSHPYSAADAPVAIIDIGSNSTRLAVVQTDGRTYVEVVEEGRAVPKLIREVSRTGVLSGESIGRVLDILRDFLAVARGSGAAHVFAVATSAVRDAANGDELVARAASALGLAVDVIHGTEEAELAFAGAVHGLPVDEGMVVDIGGGSMEVARFEGRTVRGSWTLPLGAVRLTDDFALSDPPGPGQLAALRDHAARLWREQQVPRLAPGGQLVGAGGTVRNLAKLDRAGRRYPLSRLHGYELSADRLAAMAEDLARRDVQDRAGLPGLNPDRADTIVAGATAALAVLQAAGAAGMLVSGQGMREGIALQRMGHNPASAAEVREAAVRRLVHRFGAPAEAVRARRSVLGVLTRALQPALTAEVAAALDRALEVLDVGRLMDYFTRHRQTEAILLAHGLPGFSHREVALTCALVRQAGNERSEALAYEPLVTPADVPGLGAAATLLAASDAIAQRLPPGASVAARDDHAGALALAADNSSGTGSLEVLPGRFARAFGTPLVLTGV